MRYLITGFEPFGGESINSSQETVNAVASDEFDDIEIFSGLLPVSFKRSGITICELIDESEPDVVIMLGQSGKSDSVKIERIAVNLMDAKKPDNDGYTPDEEFILNDGPSAYFSSLPVKHLRNQLFKSGVPAEVSNTAGLYVCNTTYYAALHHISITDKNIKTIFVHLPKISDEWPVLKMKDVVKQLIITINQKS